MTDIEQRGIPLTVWTGSIYGTNVGMRGETGSSVFGAKTSVAWGTSGLALAVPIWLPFKYPVRNLYVFNGATLNANVDVGIYNFEFTLLTSVGSGTAQAGASANQFFAKDIILDPGSYYFAMSANSTTATYWCNATGTAAKQRYSGTVQMASAFPLPATFVPATIGQARIPIIGATILGSPVF